MSETETDPLAGFAALMGKAGQDAQPVVEHPDAPYGYTRDEATGEMRPKKSPGRPRKSPSLDDLKARREAEAPEPAGEGTGDRPPAVPKRRRGRGGSPREEPKPAPPVPQAFRYEGGLAKGINRVYRRAGKIAIALGVVPEGRALVEMTRADEPDDVTVGDAWEHLCRTNPRVRAVWVRMLSGSATAEVFMAHLPLAIAFLMRPGVAARLPLGRLFAAVAEGEEQGETSRDPGGEHVHVEGDPPCPGCGWGIIETPFGQPSSQDMMAMMAMAQAVAEQMANGRGSDVPVRGDGIPPV